MDCPGRPHPRCTLVRPAGSCFSRSRTHPGASTSRAAQPPSSLPGFACTNRACSLRASCFGHLKQRCERVEAEQWRKDAGNARGMGRCLARGGLRNGRRVVAGALVVGRHRYPERGGCAGVMRRNPSNVSRTSSRPLIVLEEPGLAAGAGGAEASLPARAVRSSARPRNLTCPARRRSVRRRRGGQWSRYPPRTHSASRCAARCTGPFVRALPSTRARVRLDRARRGQHG